MGKKLTNVDHTTNGVQVNSRDYTVPNLELREITKTVQFTGN